MKVNLEPVEARHLTFLKNLRNEPEVQDFCRQPYQLSSQNQEDWYKQISKTREMIPFIVIDESLPPAERWVGYCALSNIDPVADKAEVSYVIDPKHRDKGYGPEAIFQLCYHAFYHLGLQKLYSDTFEYNKKEVELNKSLGFEICGVNKRHYFKRGQLISSISMALFREDFEKVWKDKLSKIVYAESKPL